jgi:uncharacterized protein YdbL (DUF1318 family)
MKHTLFGKSALAALLVTILVGTLVGCSESSGDTGTLQSIAVTRLPTKTIYTVDESLSLSGLVVTGTYSNGTTKQETVSVSNVSGYNTNTTGTQTLTVTVGGKTATFSVTVTAVGAATLQSIAVTSQPAKTTYTVGESLNLGGLVVTGTYSDGTTKQESVNIANISGYNADAAGTQTLTVTVNGKTATFVVKVSNNSGVSLDDIANYLAKAQGGDTMSNPVSLSVSGSLGNDIRAILSAINGAGKYVMLDLSACAMPGTTFDPGTGAGAGKVVELVLPDAARSIKSGASSSNGTFKDFTTLASISGAGVATIGSYAFWDCTALESVSLPSATSIGNYAFAGTALTSVNLPSATSIDDYAFARCAALESVSLPAARTIGASAFRDCAALESVSLPAVTSIAELAFCECTALTSVSLPATPPSKAVGRTIYGDYGIFRGTAGSGTITITVPASAVPVYTSVWQGGYASVSSGGDTNAYGSRHKAVRITGAAQ